jgi:hypothetical protein
VRVIIAPAAAGEEALQRVYHTLETKLQTLGVAPGKLTVVPVNEIARTGTGAKERLVRIEAS